MHIPAQRGPASSSLLAILAGQPDGRGPRENPLTVGRITLHFRGLLRRFPDVRREHSRMTCRR